VAYDVNTRTHGDITMARTKGAKQFAAEISESLLDEFKAFCEQRGETLRYNLEAAIRRHMDNPPPPLTPPPPPAYPPLPPVTSPASEGRPEPKKPAPKGKPKK